MSEQAGREMDARVAEKVMGWKLFRVGYRGTDDETPEQTLYKKEFERAGFEAVGWYAWTGEKVILWEDDFTEENCYSTSIEAAWEVVEMVKTWGYDQRIDFGIELCKDMEVGSVEYSYGDFVNDLFVITPLKICLAALKAVGAEGEGL